MVNAEKEAAMRMDDGPANEQKSGRRKKEFRLGISRKADDQALVLAANARVV